MKLPPNNSSLAAENENRTVSCGPEEKVGVCLLVIS